MVALASPVMPAYTAQTVSALTVNMSLLNWVAADRSATFTSAMVAADAAITGMRPTVPMGPRAAVGSG